MYRGYFTRNLRDPADVEDEEEYEARQRRIEKKVDEEIDRRIDEECEREAVNA